MKFGSRNLLEPSGPVQACNGIALPFSVSLERLRQFVYQPLKPEQKRQEVGEEEEWLEGGGGGHVESRHLVQGN
jgi:hypothetical protein